MESTTVCCTLLHGFEFDWPILSDCCVIAHESTQCGKTEMVQFLIEHGANVNRARESDAMTALILTVTVSTEL